MRYLNTLLIALASALCATYLALWFTKPSPIENTTIPPLIFKEEQDDVVIWGGWKTAEGYQAPGTNAVEIRCNRTSNTCHEAVASILHHNQGEDLEAQVFSYKISSWDSTKLEAVAEHAMGECLERYLVVHIPDKSAALSWSPPDGCEGDTGRAVLVGDPL
ncbi:MULTISPECIES: hypothetical protein [unclassified Pseudomonas]|uniref:hypothetical protein n=1 Tax=unclassified Pseudomonas TaxID=196821 RepID=UPI002446EABE|nr:MULTISPECIES: hypothetical protein [unclassified Pseudomonas]MDG9929059.1 hypothetical protein [Pseudomonas sp. GD04042]MDH0483772.1 hypothetical protein [Pseudomonas sp. GD04015]MDH0604929.1 hypothetical protein [Pseudomonas sp. GD03869]